MWGFLTLGRHAAVEPPPVSYDDEDHDERDHDDGTTDADADAHPLLPQLGGALLGGALLVLGPALGLRLALTGH